MHDLRPGPSGPVDVTVAARGRTSPEGIRVHCVRTLDPRDVTVVDAIPVTTVARSVLDYAEIARPQHLRLALEEAERRDALDGRVLDALLERCHGRRGVQPLREALAAMNGPAPWTQSELERRFLALVRAAGLPEPRCNVAVEGFLVDSYWPDAGLVVEADSWRFQKSRTRFERDRRQDTALVLAGIRTVRVTRQRVANEPARLAAELHALLIRRPA
jgi:very-short-patch-repair endonuclease